MALIGSMVFVFLAVLAIWMFLRLSRNPQQFIQDGDAGMEAASHITDPNQLDALYKEVRRNYSRALGLVKTDELKIAILYKMVKLNIASDKWKDAVNCWATIVRLDPKDIQARYARLKYLYQIAQESSGMVWQEVASQANELIDIIENKDADPELATTDTEKWEVEALKQKDEKPHRLGPYLYLIRGTANLMNAKLGTVTNKEEVLRTAIEDLQKAKQMQPDDVDIYMRLAQAIALRGDIETSKGILDAKKSRQKEAIGVLKEGVEATNDSLQANINLLGMKREFNVDQADTDPNQMKFLLDLEPEFLALTSKFKSNAEAYATLANFYSDPRLGSTYLDKSIKAIEKAIELDKNNVYYASAASSLYSRRYNIQGQKQDIDKAIEIIKQALLLPDAQETTGPGRITATMHQILLNSKLVDNYTDLILDSPTPKGETEKRLAAERLAEAEKAARRIEQIYRSGDDPRVIKWQGIVELAAAKLGKGDLGAAIRKLYNVYTELKSSGASDPRLSYKLAKVFANSSESGAVAEFLLNALEKGIETTQPKAWLDYAAILNQAGRWRMALAVTDVFEQRYGVTDRSRALRIMGLTGAGDFEEANRRLEQIPNNNPDWMALKIAILEGQCRRIHAIIEHRKEKQQTDIVLQDDQPQIQRGADPRSNEQLTAEMKYNLSEFIEYMDKMLKKDPNSVDTATLASVCQYAIATGNLEQAKVMADKTLAYNPDSPTGLFYKHLLAEPDPANVSPEKTKQIREEILTQISDPVSRTMALGTFYQTYEEPNKAEEYFRKLVPISGTPQLQADGSTQRRAVGYLFDIVLFKKDWETVGKIVQLARSENLDECSGEFFAARAAMAKEQYETALSNIDNVLAQRPVFGYGYLVRSSINAELGKEAAALADIQTASKINPFDKTIARELARRLYVRNQNLGDNVTPMQITETRAALYWAMRMNPGDLALTSFYAEYISDTDPQQALAMRQRLQERAPSLQNALLLARLASQLAMDSTDTQQRQALFAMAESALEQAKSYDPQNPAVLDSYSEYYRITGQQQKASQMLATAPQLQWRYYVKTGQYDEALKVLEQSYETNPKDADTLKGLLYLGEKTRDKEAVEKYGEELLAVEQTADNQLLLIQTCLGVGLIKEAEQGLASFRDRYPQDNRGLLLTAWLSMKHGRLKESMEMINKCLESDQTNATAWQLRGEINNMLMQYEQAISDLQQSKTLMDSPITRLALAKVYLKVKHIEDAITELKGIVEDPQAPDDARTLLEIIYTNSGRTEALNDFYAAILEKMPENIYWLKHAAGFAGASGNLAKAEQLYTQALQKSAEQGKQDPDALNGYMRAILAQGMTEKLFNAAAKYIDGDLAFVAYYWMAEARMKLGDRQNAVEYCYKAMQKAQQNLNIQAEITQRTYSLLGGPDTERLCKRLLNEQPDGIPANWAMFNLCSLKGDYNAANDYIDKCIAAASTEDNNWTTFTIQKATTLVKAYMKTSDNNRLQEALVAYESLLEKMPNNTSILNNVAYILADNNQDLDKALEYAKRAHEAKPDDPEYLDTYALVLHKMGRNSEAVQFQQAAIQQYEAQRASTPADAYEHLGLFLEQLGEKSRARTAYEQALEANGSNAPPAVKQRINDAIERLEK